MEKISKKITKWMLAKQVITRDDEEVYVYGVFQLLMSMLNTVSILMLAVIFHKILAVCCYIICFSMLRKYVGGYHAKSVKGCYLMTVGSTALMLWVICFNKIPMAVIFTFWMLCGVFVFLFAPVENRNKKLDEVERVVYRKKALVIWMLESVVLWGIYGLKFFDVTEGIVFGNILIVISMFVELKSLAKDKEKRRKILC